jgi:cation-transporting ATPase E
MSGPERSSRSYLDIVRANVLTRFNALVAGLAVVVLAAGEPFDALFAFVMVFNVVIGIVQEVRAKRTLDALRVLVAPSYRVERDGTAVQVRAEELVVGDVVLLGAGDEIPIDGRVLRSTGLEVDESALTGESEPVGKVDGDEVLSGSIAVAGSAAVVAERVGNDAWIHQLVAQAKEFVLTRSELRVGVDRILQIVSWIVVPLGALLLWSQLRTDAEVREALVAAVAGVVALVPQGLVLLVSMAMAVAILRLARQHVVVQELHAVEGLARIDVICLDKTGTLTTGKIVLESVEPLDGDAARLDAALAALAAAEPVPTTTMQLLAAELPPAPDWTATGGVAFSSARKWSATSFADEHGTWVLGAPEILLDAVDETDSAVAPALAAGRSRVEELAVAAKRVLLVARCDTPIAEPADGEEATLPPGLQPAGLVVLTEQVRGDAAATMRYFTDQHVAVKVISGDNPRTVAAVAGSLGVVGAERAVDMRTVDVGDEASLDRLVEETTVFGRVLPEQKRALVGALQRAGHTVAMTGDGVNDIPALKAADIGIAMDTATPATRRVAQLVLLDGRFDRMPDVVSEGRRVIANMERVSSLFITKTVYAAVFAIVVGITAVEFPFLPRHLSLMDAITIGIPGFVLSFRSTDRPTRSGYLRRVVRFAVPAGLAVAFTTLTTYALNRSSLVDATLAEARTAAVIALTVTALWVLSRLMWPIDLLEGTLLAALSAMFVVALTWPWLAELFSIALPPREGWIALIATVLVSIVAFQAALWLDLARRLRPLVPNAARAAPSASTTSTSTSTSAASASGARDDEVAGAS